MYGGSKGAIGSEIDVVAYRYRARVEYGQVEIGIEVLARFRERAIVEVYRPLQVASVRMVWKKLVDNPLAFFLVGVIRGVIVESLWALARIPASSGSAGS